jgi:hypothetical protein
MAPVRITKKYTDPRGAPAVIAEAQSEAPAGTLPVWVHTDTSVPDEKGVVTYTMDIDFDVPPTPAA